MPLLSNPLSASRQHHHLDRLAVVHRAVAIRHLVEADHPVEDAPGVDPALEHVRQKVVDVGADGSGAAGDRDVVLEGRLCTGDRLVLRNTDAADSAAGTCDLDCRLDSLVEADTLER